MSKNQNYLENIIFAVISKVKTNRDTTLYYFSGLEVQIDKISPIQLFPKAKNTRKKLLADKIYQNTIAGDTK